MTFRFFIFTLLLLNPATSQALYLSQQTLYSSAQLIESLNSDGDIGTVDAPFSWNLYAGYDKTTTPNDGAPPIVDETYSYSGGINWAGDSDYGLGGKLNYSNTPAEQLEARGAQVTASYHWSYAAFDAETLFTPYLTFKIIGSTTNNIETFSGQIPRKKGAPTNVGGISELQQSVIGFDFNWKPVKFWRFDFEVDQSFFNRDVANFQNRLDSATAFQTGMSGFTGTVGGLSRVTYNFGIFWEFVTGWRIDLTEQYSLLAADNSSSSTTKTTIYDQITKRWKITTGVEVERSNALNDTLAILELDCEI